MESECEETQVASRNANSVKERPAKVACLQQEEKCDPRIVSFCKKRQRNH